MALARNNTITDPQIIRNMERGENFAYLWNGFLIVLLGFFIPTPLYIALLVTYAIAGAVLKVYRNGAREKLFNFFDKVASFFGYPPPPEPLPEPPQIDRSFIHRRLRSYSDPAISDSNRESIHEQYREHRQRQRMFLQPQNIVQIPIPIGQLHQNIDRLIFLSFTTNIVQIPIQQLQGERSTNLNWKGG